MTANNQAEEYFKFMLFTYSDKGRRRILQRPKELKI